MAGNNDFLPPLSGDTPKIISELLPWGGVLKTKEFLRKLESIGREPNLKAVRRGGRGLEIMVFCNPSQAIRSKMMVETDQNRR